MELFGSDGESLKKEPLYYDGVLNGAERLEVVNRRRNGIMKSNKEPFFVSLVSDQNSSSI